ncbi:unnamed protein product, partial [Mesorhabditis spiculigera]
MRARDFIGNDASARPHAVAAALVAAKYEDRASPSSRNLPKKWVVSAGQRLYIAFNVMTKGTKEALRPHQVFVLLEHAETSANIVFVADLQKDGTYISDIDMNKVGADFDGHCGKFHARLIIGDSTIKNAIDWNFADIDIATPPTPIGFVKKSEQVFFEPLPSITHQFRQPAKRPPGIVSDAFTLLCLAPLKTAFGRSSALRIVAGQALAATALQTTPPNSHCICKRGVMKLPLVLLALAAAIVSAKEPSVDNFKVGVLEKGADVADLKSITLFSKSAEKWVVSASQRLYIAFNVMTKGTKEALRPHQVFVLLEHAETSADIVFVADLQKDGTYISDIDMNKVGADFDGHCGKFHARLIIGDATIKNPIDWNFADIDIAAPPTPIGFVKKSEQVMKLPLVLLALAAAIVSAKEPSVDNFKVGVLEKGADVADLKSITLFSKSAEKWVVSASQRLYIAFNVMTKGTKEALRPHQVFVLLEHAETSADIVFVADLQKDGTYISDIDMNKVGADFDGHSGKFHARLIIGDATIKNPIDWNFADIDIATPPTPIGFVKKSEQVFFEPLPSITHQFRQPEKRPPGIVSDAFTLLCLAPLVILVGLWLKIGINFSNMPVNLWTLLFHAGLAAIFGLYMMFWLRLNMFDTLKYLAIVGSVTAFAGNRLLRSIASQRKEKKN